MTSGSRQSPRLVFKRAFTEYFVALNTPAIADPTEAFAACRDYLQALVGRLGRREFMNRLDDETTRLAGQVEQDLRQRYRGRDVDIDFGDLEERLRECMEQGLAQFDTPFDAPPRRPPVE